MNDALLQPKSGYVLAPKESAHLDWSATAAIVIVYFNPKILAETAATLGLADTHSSQGERTSDPLICNIAAMVRDIFVNGMGFPQLVATSATSLLAIRLLSRVNKTLSNKREQLSPMALKRVMSFVENNLVEDFGLEEMARSAGCSRFHFARAFRSRIGMSPWRYVTRCRLSRAENLLRTHKELSVAEICHMVGFQDQSHFTRAFKSAFSMTPGNFRRQALEATA